MPAQRKFCNSAISVKKSIIHWALFRPSRGWRGKLKDDWSSFCEVKYFKLLFTFLIAAAIFFFSSGVVLAENLLQNWGFEEGDFGWNKYGSTQLNIVNNTLNDSKAGMLTSDKSGVKYIYQEFNTREGEEFQLSGWVNWSDDFISNAKLRLDWYDEFSKRVGLDEISLASRSEEWQYLAGSAKAPPLSKKVKFEVYAYFNKANPSKPTLFDDLFFSLLDQSTSVPTPTSIPTPTPTSSPNPSSISYPSRIILSEFMPAPPDNESEWVEIKNTSSSEVVLTDWKIDDVADGGGSAKNFSATVSGGSYFKIDLGSGFLNNSGDEVRLLYPDSSVADEISYSYSNTGVSWIKTNGSWCEAENPTPGSANSSCQSQSSSDSSGSTPTPTSSPTSSPTKSPTPTPKGTEATETLEGEVLGEESSPQGFYPLELATPSPEVLGDKILNSRILPKIFLVAGLAFLGAAAYWLWYNLENEGRSIKTLIRKTTKKIRKITRQKKEF